MVFRVPSYSKGITNMTIFLLFMADTDHVNRINPKYLKSNTVIDSSTFGKNFARTSEDI